MRLGLDEFVPGLFSVEAVPGTYEYLSSARWPEPQAGDRLDEPAAVWLDRGRGAAELAGPGAGP